jgi:hypothetical protein
MTDQGWAMWIAKLVLAFPDREQSREQAQARAALYRERLDELSDEQWTFAVEQSIRRERWFPTVAVLLDYAAQYQPVGTSLPPPRRSPEQVEADRAVAREGLRVIREAVSKTPLPAPPRPFRVAPAVVELTDERFDLLRAQAQELRAPGRKE